MRRQTETARHRRSSLGHRFDRNRADGGSEHWRGAHGGHQHRHCGHGRPQCMRSWHGSAGGRHECHGHLDIQPKQQPSTPQQSTSPGKLDDLPQQSFSAAKSPGPWLRRGPCHGITMDAMRRTFASKTLMNQLVEVPLLVHHNSHQLKSMPPILSLILIGTSALAALSISPLAPQASIDNSHGLIGLNSHTSELLACGGGGSGSYRKPLRPGHAKPGDSADPRGTQPTSTDIKPVQTNMNSSQT